MKKNIKTIDNLNGVKAFLTGFKTEEIAEKIESCQNGQCGCSCDPLIMEKIENIELKEEENKGLTITITGNLDSKTIEPMMKECLI